MKQILVLAIPVVILAQPLAFAQQQNGYNITVNVNTHGFGQDRVMACSVLVKDVTNN